MPKLAAIPEKASGNASLRVTARGPAAPVRN
jgi:hypothetical protein